MTPRHFYIILLILIFGIRSNAQIAPNFEIATWYQFKTAALSYTFDDFTPKQYSVALPLFDQYNYKVTFYVITNNELDWTNLQTAASNGHEIGCHTSQHIKLDQQTIAEQEFAITSALSKIDRNIPQQKCLSIAYPYCVPGNQDLISRYFIAGRVCSDAIEPKSPSDFYQISSISVGNKSQITSALQLNNQIEKAKTANGWCVFLLHAIDNDEGYSPIQSRELADHLSYVDIHSSDYWTANFIAVVKYIKERDAATINETQLSNDSLLVNLNDGLDNTIFNSALSIRRSLPDDWNKAKVYQNGKLIKSTITNKNAKQYIEFEAIPDAGTISISSGTVTPIYPKITLKQGWNNVTCPINGNTPIASALSSVWTNVEIVKSENRFYDRQLSTSLNQLITLDGGQQYVIKVSADCELDWIIR